MYACYKRLYIRNKIKMTIHTTHGQLLKSSKLFVLGQEIGAAGIIHATGAISIPL